MSKDIQSLDGVPTEASAAVSAVPLSDALGAQITNVDASRPLFAAVRARIVEALLEHHLLVFRDQRLSDAELQAFAQSLGDLEGHVFTQADGTTIGAVHTITNLDAEGRPSASPYLNSNYFWHSDKAYLANPCWITMLYGVELPPAGGDTEFANLNLAYEALPDETKRKIAALRVVNSYDYMFRSTGDYRLPEEVRTRTPPVEHPLVRVHPDTGARSLFLSMHNERIVGMTVAEGRTLLDALLKHATQPQFVFAQKWKLGDLIFWDNRSLMHRAVPNYGMETHRRVLKRVVVRQPYAA